MNTVLQEDHLILSGFAMTVALFLVAAVGAIVVGTGTAAMRVSPLPPLRWVAATYVGLVRNTPLTVVFFIVVFGLPQVDITLPFFTFAAVALVLYTAPFVAETLRSGIRSVPVGQLEAARSLGMTFPKVLHIIVIPQAARTVVAPMASVLIALLKNTSVASAFGVVEAISTMNSLASVHSSVVIWFLVATAVGYVVLATTLGRTFALIERRVEVLR